MQRSAYRVEASLIGSDAMPPLHDTLDTLILAGLTWFGVRDAAGLLGAVGLSPDGDDIERLVVAPRAFRRGIGTALVQHVLTLVGGPVTVSTGRDNTPARALYARCGFVEIGEAEVEPDLWITRYGHPHRRTEIVSPFR